MPERSEKPAKTGKTPKAAKKDTAAPPAPAPAPEASSGRSSRVNIALPFSQIRMQEPSQELAETVALIGALVVALKDSLSATQYEELEAQVESLRARLR